MGSKKRNRGVGGPTHKQGTKSKSDISQGTSSIEAPVGSEPRDILEIYKDKFDYIVSNGDEIQGHGQADQKDGDTNHRLVPLVHRAQIEHRSQLQRIVRDSVLDSLQYVREWIGKPEEPTPNALVRVSTSPPAYRPANPFHTTGISKTFEIQIAWRLLSNSGLIPDLICPVIGSGGWPFIPGSSIKGLFKRACTPEQAKNWCGTGDETNEIKPGCLRFHGAWPKDVSWRNGLLDLTHPQEAWQIGFKSGSEGHNANAVISLLRPILQVGISSQRQLNDVEWSEISRILQVALSNGIGGRTSTGYGATTAQAPSDNARILFSENLRGQGPASKLLDGSPEFRPTMFRAAIRSMALRLFAGITDEQAAQAEVEHLFGGFHSTGKPVVGQLACQFSHTVRPKFGAFGIRPNQQQVFVCQGDLSWHLASSAAIGENEKKLLIDLLYHLHALAMTLCGFGRSWRRPDHRIFLASYKTRPIGCHWEWGNPDSLPHGFIPQDSSQLGALIEETGKSAFDWLSHRRALKPRPVDRIWSDQVPNWREVIHPAKMKVWCRLVEKQDQSSAITWIHRPKQGEYRESVLDLSKSRLKGGFFPHDGKSRAVVSRLWIKMFPVLRAPVKHDPVDGYCPHVDPLVLHDDVQLTNIWSGPYLEIVTLFPASSRQQDPEQFQHQKEFIAGMDAAGASRPFVCAWGSYKYNDY